MNKPKPPTKFDLTPESYNQHNRYFNEAEKYINHLESQLTLQEIIDIKESIREIEEGEAIKFNSVEDCIFWLKTSDDKHKERI